MQSAIPVHGRPARNALSAGFNCANIMWKPAADAARSSVRPALYFIERSTRSCISRPQGTSRAKKLPETSFL